MSRKITFLTLFLWLMTVTFPVIAQQKTDTTYTFRFVPQKDMFYVPWNGNDTELARLAKTEHSHPLGMVVSTHFRCGKGVKRGLKNGALPFNID